MKQRVFVISCAIVCALALAITVVNVIRYIRPFPLVHTVENTSQVYSDGDEVIDVRNMLPTSIKISPKYMDFGTVYADSILTAKFSVINTGPEVLYLQKLKADCLCTSAIIDKSAATPRDSVIVTLILNTQGKEGDNTIYATFMTNTKEIEHKIRLRVRVENKLDK